ncbi:4-hydroxy-3-methylbut-2-enyl diphosphate reductase [Thermodesulfobacteriota bacterium]
MKILISKTSGFCMGVRRAVEMVLDASAEQNDSIYTFGPLIHNPQVLNVLEEKGIRILTDVPDNGSGTVLIRAHGVPPATKDKLIKSGFNLIDATCPRVIKIQTIIKKYADQHFEIIIIGNKDHPEVIGLLGCAGQKGHIVNSIEELDRLPALDKAIIVAQSTQNTAFFEEVERWIQNNRPYYKTFNTICGSTEKRQTEVRKLAESADAVIVVGGCNSGNTQRLAEIAKQSGKPVYHIETEVELDSLDPEAIVSVAQVGVTAGASTPNWVIKKVYRALEKLPYKQKHGWRSIVFAFQRSLLLTNIYVSLGAGCLCYACAKLQNISHYSPYVLISIFYILSMHILNNLTGTKEDKFNDPDRAAFYQRHKHLLTLMAVTAGGAGILIAYILGVRPFLILFVMSILGLSYNLRIVPDKLKGLTVRRIRDIPGSKTILIAMAWGILAAIIPPLAASGSITWVNVLMFLWAGGLVFARTSFFDILDIQGDRIVGKETIAIFLGEERMMRLLKTILTVLIALLPVFSALRLISPIGFVLTLCPAFILIALVAFKKGYLLPGIRMEFLVETNFILAGLITFIWLSIN